MKGGVVIEEGFIYEEETHLTVFKTSLSFSSDGFAVYDCKGDLVFRVDSYRPDTHDRAELVLMDASGRCLLTVRRKRLSLHHRWEGFVGERTDGQKPIFSVKRSSIIGRSSLTVEVNDNPEEYQIEGSFAQRCCTILDGEKQSVAEIKRKVDASTNVLLGKDVISLLVKPGFDGCFAVALVLVIDQINGDDFDEGARVEVVDISSSE
ncbi:Protein LURP-one-related 12 [Camellia lanceoleosa]|uniref:Protein LURP-one-related 12 n=1 Tax=Camellia lanceoleosa TaxID=1840588 RepID=A0ACC0HY40_9ERIC|nr:Protein LURP-one-related 12 [Camellia lanceoleosa]